MYHRSGSSSAECTSTIRYTAHAPVIQSVSSLQFDLDIEGFASVVKDDPSYSSDGETLLIVFCVDCE